MPPLKMTSLRPLTRVVVNGTTDVIDDCIVDNGSGDDFIMGGGITRYADAPRLPPPSATTAAALAFKTKNNNNNDDSPLIFSPKLNDERWLSIWRDELALGRCWQHDDRRLVPRRRWRFVATEE